MEKHLGRALTSKEIVHHINHDRLDNRIENLQLMSRAEHLQEHLQEVMAARLATPRRTGPKITVQVAAAIKRDVAAGETKASVARRYGLSATMVCYIANGKNWKNA